MPKLDRSEIERLVELSGKATEGPYYIGEDRAEDTIPHKNSGLALIDTGRTNDWPVARLQEWREARFLCELANWFRANSAALLELEQDARRKCEWIEKVKLEIRALDAQAERITRREQTTWRDGADQEPHDEDFEEVIIGYKMNTGCWHRLLGLLACAPDTDAKLRGGES